MDNYPNPLSGLTNSAPSLIGGKSFLSGGTGGSRVGERPQACSRSFAWCLVQHQIKFTARLKLCRPPPTRGPICAHAGQDRQAIRCMSCQFVTIRNQAQRSQTVCGSTTYCQCQEGAVYSRMYGLCRALGSHDPAAHGPPSYGQSLGKPRP